MPRILMILSILVPLGACATAGAGAGSVSAVDRGRFVALRSCAGCHAVGGSDRSPNATSPPFSRLRLRYDAAGLRRRLADISRNGHVEMPPIYMTEDEIRDVAEYIQTIEPVGAPAAAGAQLTARSPSAVGA